MGQTGGEGRWITVVAAMFALAVSSGPLLQFSFALFIQPVTAAFASDRATTSLALAAGMIASGLATPFAGMLMDRYGIRRVTLPASILLALALAGIGLLTQGPRTYIASYVVTGIFSAALAPLPFAKSISARFHAHRGLAIGIAMAGVGIGAALLPQAVRFLIDQAGWRGAYIGLAGMVLLVGVPGAIVGLPATAAAGAAPIVKTSVGLTSREAVRSPLFYSLAASFFLMAMACNGIVAHLVALLSERATGSGAPVLALSASGLAIIVGRVLSGTLLDRFIPTRVAAAFFMAPLAGILILLFLPWPGWIGAALIGLGLGAEVDLIAYLIGRFFGHRAFGAIFGYMFLTFTLGSAIGPLIMAASYGRGSYTPAMLVFAALLVCGSVIVWRIGDPKLNIIAADAGV